MIEETQPQFEGPIVIVPNPEIGFPEQKIIDGICALVSRHYIIQYPGDNRNLVIPLESVVKAGLVDDNELDFAEAYRVLLEQSIDPRLN